MTHRRLAETWTAYRIGDPNGKWPIWDDAGARRMDGRWHAAGCGVIYASRHYSTAMLEKLVHFQGVLPTGQHFIEITIPHGVTYEVVNPDTLPGWSDRNGTIARDFGTAWALGCRSAMLVVPSVVARMECNLIFNTAHPEFRSIRPGLETPVWWDDRLFG